MAQLEPFVRSMHPHDAPRGRAGKRHTANREGKGMHLFSLKGLETVGRGGGLRHQLMGQARRAAMGKSLPGSAPWWRLVFTPL